MLNPTNTTLGHIDSSSLDLLPKIFGLLVIIYNHVNRQFQANTSQHKIAMSLKLWIRSSRNLRINLRLSFSLCGWSAVTLEKIEYCWRPPSWKMDMTSKFCRMADFCFQKPEVVISQQWIEMSRRNLLRKYIRPTKWATSRKPKPEVELRCSGRCLEKWIWRHN